MRYLPQIVYFILILYSLVFTAYKHGEPKGNYSLIDCIISIILQTLIMFWGGFFNVFFK